MRDILVQKTAKTTRDTYSYKATEVNNSNVTIVFLNKKLKDVQVDLNPTTTLGLRWRVYGAISKKIHELEEIYASE